MARFGAGLAEGADLLAAAEVAAQQAVSALGGRRPDLACVFVCGLDASDVSAAGVRAGELAGATTTIGCNASGVLGAGAAVEARSSVAVWCAVLPDVRVRAFHLEVLPAEDGMAVVGLPTRDEDDVVGVLFADPWSFPVDGFVARSNDALAGLPFVGGCASGLGGRGASRLFLDGAVVSRGAVGVLLAGPVGARAVVSQGCRPIGPPMTVTGCDGPVILELAGTPALTKLEQVVATLDLGDQALVSTGLQLGIAMDEYADSHGVGDFLVRAITGAATERDGIVVGDVVPLGSTVQFQLRDADAAEQDLRETLRRARESWSLDTVEGALLFSCNGRGAQMFAVADHDVATLAEELAVDAVAGFFAAGEIGPVGGRNHMHGLTAAVLAFGSGAGASRGTA